MSTRVSFVISKTVPTTRLRGVRRGTVHPFDSDNTTRTVNAKENATGRLIQIGGAEKKSPKIESHK